MEPEDKHRFFNLSSALITSCLIFITCKDTVNIPEFTGSNTGPYIMNVDHMEFLKSQLDSIPVLKEEYIDLITGSNKLIGEQFEYVTDKTESPPSGDKHDYMSLSRYAWPNDSTGIYDDQKDGKTNPEIYDYDRPKLARFSSAVHSLSLAYFFTENELYAEKATELIRNWFLVPETRMNPNMNHAQIAFGVNTGSAQGIIDANDFINVIEAISLIYDSQHWYPEDHIAMKKWFYDFSKWIIKNYNADAFQSTNVSTWLDVQRSIYFLFTEQNEYLDSSSHILPITDKIQVQLTSEGLLPNEKNRVRSQHYVYYNLRAYMKIALIRKNRTGKDRDWPQLSSYDQAGLKPALHSLISYLNGEDVSRFFNVSEEFDICRYLEVFKPAAIAFESEEYDLAAQQLLQNGCSNPNITLVYPELSKL